MEDEGEEDGSVYGDVDVDDDSMSEDSASSHPDDGDGEGSDVTEHELHETNGHGAGQAPKDGRGGASSTRVKKRTKNLFESKVSETEAMLNGLKLTEEGEKLEELDFENMKEDAEPAAAAPSSRQENNKSSKRETFTERKRRENEQYVKEREENPAFVPTRGGFFLHDKRTNSPSNGHRNSNKAKSKPHGLIVDSNAPRYALPKAHGRCFYCRITDRSSRRSTQKSDVTDGPWRHDLHETVARKSPSSYPPQHPNPTVVTAPRPVPTAPRSTPPNRSFSSTVLIGNVPVVVSLPGMKAPIPFATVPKKQHTRLPQHRPPLRRDKPVRISLPGQPPRYIFPSVERSFIFIPRAMRPNQQYRGRGRGGFYGARRSSVYGGSVYTPSLPMSRRSSFGRPVAGSDICSPAASIISRATMVPGEGGKPIVRLPPNMQPPSSFIPALPSTYVPPQPAQFPANKPHQPIPMHQPRPQKTVSVADIESPMTFPPLHPQEHAFHQQMPPPANGQGFVPVHPPQASATPLSQIPEQAIHAAPFQPVPYPQQPGYYPATGYPPGPAAYPMTSAEYPVYNTSAPVFVPQGQGQGQQMQYPMSGPAGEQGSQTGTVAHESNGTVYFYDTSQYSNAPYPAPSQGGVVGMGGMMTPPGPTYYYPPQPNYYG